MKTRYGKGYPSLIRFFALIIEENETSAHCDMRDVQISQFLWYERDNPIL